MHFTISQRIIGLTIMGLLAFAASEARADVNYADPNLAQGDDYVGDQATKYIQDNSYRSRVASTDRVEFIDPTTITDLSDGLASDRTPASK